METGQRGLSARDIGDLCDLYGIDGDERERLATLARQGKQRAWWQPLDLPYSTYIGLEAEAAVISDFGISLVPGLLQTADYARAVVSAAVPHWVPEIVEQRVNGRLARQRILTADNAPRFQAVLEESVLRRVVGSPAIMVEQLEHLVEVAELPNVSVRLIPFTAGALPAVNKFIILNFGQPTVPDVVFVEGLTGDLYFEDIADLENYNATFWALSEAAVSEEDTRTIIAALITVYRSSSIISIRADPRAVLTVGPVLLLGRVR